MITRYVQTLLRRVVGEANQFVGSFSQQNELVFVGVTIHRSTRLLIGWRSEHGGFDLHFRRGNGRRLGQCTTRHEQEAGYGKC